MSEDVRALERKLAGQIAGDRLLGYTREIARWVRLSGSKEERQAAEWVLGQLRSFGVDARIVEHDAYISLPGAARLTVTSPAARDIACITHAFAIPTPPGGVEAELVYVGMPANLGRVDVRGKFALVEGLATPWAAKALTAAGALGHVHVCPGEQRYEMIVSPVWGSPSHETRGQLPRTHIASVNTPDGQVLKGLLQQGPVRIRLQAEVDTGWRKTPIVLGEIRGSMEPERYILFSGHLDSWHHGAMDNGSANAVMLEVCRLLAGEARALRRSLRVAFWSGHSHGRYSGSAWYCDEHWEDLDRNCCLHLNIDSPGGKGATVLDAGKVHAETRAFVAQVIKEYSGQDFVGGRMYRAGDESFWPVGIPGIHAGSAQNVDDGGLNPTGMVLGKAKTKANGLGWWWHTPEDTLDKLDPDILARDCRIYLALALRLCTAPVLPLDYRAAAAEIVEILQGLQSAAGDKFDLGPCLEPARRLCELTDRLTAAVEAAGERDAARLNACLMRLGRILIPLGYTKAGRFAQDPAELPPPLPSLADAAKLKDLAADSDEAKFIAVALRRGRNRVRQGLLEAIAAVEQVVGA